MRRKIAVGIMNHRRAWLVMVIPPKYGYVEPVVFCLIQLDLLTNRYKCLPPCLPTYMY